MVTLIKLSIIKHHYIFYANMLEENIFFCQRWSIIHSKIYLFAISRE